MGKQNADQCSPKHNEGKEQKQKELPLLFPPSNVHRVIFNHDTTGEFQSILRTGPHGVPATPISESLAIAELSSHSSGEGTSDSEAPGVRR